MKIKAERLRHISRWLPLPGRMVRARLDAWEAQICLPAHPQVVSAHGGCGRFEIRNYREYIQRNIYFLGYYEIRETRLIRSLLRKGDTFIDAGANIGWFTVLAARAVGERGRVIAFEPSGSIFDHLNRNIALNGLKNVQAEKCALSDETGTAVLSGISERNAGIGSITALSSEAAGQDLLPAETVATLRLDDYWSQKNSVDDSRIRLVKIDVEGAESKVLRGMRKLIEERRCDHLLVEVNDERLRQVGESAEEVLQLLRQNGYTLFHVGFGKPIPLDGLTDLSTLNILASAGK